jgi:hypothetical protein
MRAESVDSMVAPTRSNRSSISSTEHVAGSDKRTGQNHQKLSHGVFLSHVNVQGTWVLWFG